MYKKDLHVRLLGFSSVVELVGAMPEIVKIERPTKTGDWYLTLKTSSGTLLYIKLRVKLARIVTVFVGGKQTCRIKQ